MKKYILTLIILTLMLFSPRIAKADEEVPSCYEPYVYRIDSIVQFPYHYDISSDSWYCEDCVRGNFYRTIEVLYEVKPNTTYYFKFFSDLNEISKSLRFYDSNKVYLSEFDYFISNRDDYFSFDIPDNSYYVSFIFNFNSHTSASLLSDRSFALADFDLTECPVIEEPVDPIDPNNPIVQETDQVKILQNFYTLFLDRLKFISEYAINNYLFLAFIGIILLFVILEIFLYLYNRGGYK